MDSDNFAWNECWKDIEKDLIEILAFTMFIGKKKILEPTLNQSQSLEFHVHWFSLLCEIS